MSTNRFSVVRLASSRWLQIGLFALLLTTHFALHFSETNSGRPYEGWDEIATYNTAQVITGPTAGRVYRYGTLDTGLQVLAIEAYERFDPVGRTIANDPYVNNVPRSFSEPDLNLKPRSWTGVDYNYFRGMSDRTAIFWSRKLHLAAAYLIAGASGLIALWVYGRNGWLVVLPLMAFISAPTMYYETARSLPSASAALLGFLCTLAAMMFHDRGRIRYLVLSAIALALAANFKIDALLVGMAPTLALVLMTRERGLKFALSAALWSGVAFFATSFLTRPPMWRGPIRDFLERRAVLDASQVELGREMLASGLTLDRLISKAMEFANFLGSDGVFRAGPDSLAIGVFAIGVAAVAAALMLRRDRRDLTVSIGFANALFVLGFLFIAYLLVWDRYWLSGMAALSASVGMLLLLSRGSPTRKVQIAVWVGVAFLIVQLAVNTAVNLRAAQTIARHAVTADKFDGRHTRTAATLLAIELAKTKGLEVLVDQHAYIDTRPFRLAGIQPKPLNKYNFSEVLADGRPKLVVFAHGSTDQSTLYHIPWIGTWSETEKSLYSAYQARLLSLPVIRRFGGQPQLVLDVGPVRAEDEIVVSTMSTPP